MLIKEVEVKNLLPVSPEKARLDALKLQKDNLNKTIKTTKAREKIAQGQRQLNKALQS
jgi:cell division septal protein FtsQ